jgi:hypothetical protein
VESFSEGIAFGARTIMGYISGASAWHCVPGCNVSDYLTAYARKELLSQPEQKVTAPQELVKYENTLARAVMGIDGVFYKEKGMETHPFSNQQMELKFQ